MRVMWSGSGKVKGILFILIIPFISIISGFIKSGHSKTNSTVTSIIQSNTANTVEESASKGKSVTLKIPSHPLTKEADLDILINEIGDAKIVLLGEASHGTSDYYVWRAAISKRLIEEKGFDFIATESEWADSYKVNNFIKGEKKDSSEVIRLLKNYNRWPTWMWGNYEVASFVTWLNDYNTDKKDTAKIGFFGLDVYCLWESMSELMPYLKDKDPALVKAARKVHNCFQPFSADVQQYALEVASATADCSGEVNRLWRSLRKITGNKTGKSEAEFVMEQNALVALNGERYYSTMIKSDVDSWNIRDRHMFETLKRLMDLHGSESKAIIWEHNTHVGDARYTDMARRGEINVGQLVRKEFGEKNVFIVGFGSYQGSVIASEKWGDPYREMDVPAAQPGSWEQILHQLSSSDKIILSRQLGNEKQLKRPLGHRAIGVVYNPKYEQYGNYVPSTIPKRYDAFIFIDKSTALHPIDIRAKDEPPDTYPSGM